MSTLRVAVVGAGHLGRIHARLLGALERVELVAVADPSPAARQRAAAEIGAATEADYRALYGRIDAAVVATPTRLHREVAGELLQRGIHCLVEKPLAATLAQASELVGAAQRAGAVLQVGHVEQFNPAFAAARPHLHGAKYVEATRRGGFTFRSTDVGVVLDLMIHDLDLVLSLTDAPLVSVRALGVALVGRHEDVAQAWLEFADGLVANLSASRLAGQSCRQMQVWSAHALAQIDFGERSARVVRPSEAILRRQIDVERLSAEELSNLKDCLGSEHFPCETLVVPDRNAIADELSDFIDAIGQRRPPRVDGGRGRAALAAAEQILDSIARHRWDGRVDGPTGPLALPSLPVLRGPHWRRPQPADAPPLRREAG